MNRNPVKFFVLAISLFFSSHRPASAMGFVPVPAEPTGFTVSLSSGYAIAHWAPVDGVAEIFSMENNVELGRGLSNVGSLFSNIPVDATKPHTFTLMASNLAGNSSPVTYTYFPPAPSTPSLNTVHYAFEDNRSTGTPVLITLSFVGSQNGRAMFYADSAPGRRSAGSGLVVPDSSYTVDAYGYYPYSQRGFKCVGTVVNGDTKAYLASHTAFVTLTDANASIPLNCRISFQ